MDGYKTLKVGQRVRFTTEDGPKGVHAIDIQAIEECTAPAAADQTARVVQPQSAARSPSEEALV